MVPVEHVDGRDTLQEKEKKKKAIVKCAFEHD